MGMEIPLCEHWSTVYDAAYEVDRGFSSPDEGRSAEREYFCHRGTTVLALAIILQ
jgi:hypothetical protein